MAVMSYDNLNSMLDKLEARGKITKNDALMYIVAPFLQGLGYNTFNIDEVDIRIDEGLVDVNVVDGLSMVVSLGEVYETSKDTDRIFMSFLLDKKEIKLHFKVLGKWQEIAIINLNGDDSESYVNELTKRVIKEQVLREYSEKGEKFLTEVVLDALLDSNRLNNEFMMLSLLKEFQEPTDEFIKVMATRLNGDYTTREISWIQEKVKDGKIDVVYLIEQMVEKDLLEGTIRERSPELKNEIYLKAKDEVREEVENKVREELRLEVKQEVRNELKEDVKRELEDSYNVKLKNEINNNKSDLRVEVREEVRKELRQDVEAEIRKDVRNELKVEVRNSLKDEVKDEVRNELRSEVKDEVKNELENEVTGNVNNKVTEELRKEVKEDVRNELKDTVREEVRNELREEVKEEVRESTAKELYSKIKDEVREEVMEEIERDLQKEQEELNNDFKDSSTKDSEDFGEGTDTDNNDFGSGDETGDSDFGNEETEGTDFHSQEFESTEKVSKSTGNVDISGFLGIDKKEDKKEGNKSDNRGGRDLLDFFNQ